MADEEQKISKNRQKKIEIVASLDEKLGKSAAIIFTNYTGLTHKQLEGLKKAIKPLKAEFVVAKNSLILRALNNKKIKLENEKDLDGQTGTLFMYEDVVTPLKELAKLIKNLGIPSVKFGIMEGNRITGEEVLKLSSLPTREVLLAQLVGGLKAPIFGLHRSLNWNLQKLVMTLGAVARLPRPEPSDGGQAKSKPVDAPIPTQPVSEPETILDETKEEKLADLPADATALQAGQPSPTVEIAENQSSKAQDEVKVEGGEN